MTSKNIARPDHTGHRVRLRERFERNGFEGFADYEALELLLTLCIPRRDVKPLAKALIKHWGSLQTVLDAPAQDLVQMDGVGKQAAISLRIIREATTLYLKQNAQARVQLNNLSALEEFWKNRLGPLKQEVFEIAYLNKSHHLMENGVERIAQGDVDQVAIYLKQVLRMALQRGASHLVLAHNHPAGTPRPSQEDIHLTQNLCKAARVFDINVIDHIIVTSPQNCFSFKREGLM